MNPQPHPIVGQFGVLIFALLVAYFALTKKNKQNSWDGDTINIGYILDDNKPVAKTITPISQTQNQIPSYLVNPVPKQSTTPKKQPPVLNNILFDDCVSALVFLGTKKTQAKTITRQIFNNHKPNSVQEFITLAYTR